MTCEIQLPEIRVEAAATPSAESTLGFGASIESRVSVGRSDVLPVTPGDVVADPQLAAYLTSRTSRSLVRITLRMSLRPADGERFTRALFTIGLIAESGPPEAQPIARLLTPERLTAGRITEQNGATLALKGGVPGAVDANVGVSSQTTSELQRYYVYSLGDGESDPEWRYQATESMPELEGAFTMGLVAEVEAAFAAEAQLNVTATVRRHLRSTDVHWIPADGIRRFPIFSRHRHHDRKRRPRGAVDQTQITPIPSSQPGGRSLTSSGCHATRDRFGDDASVGVIHAASA